jgi:hypothetical protein
MPMVTTLLGLKQLRPKIYGQKWILFWASRIAKGTTIFLPQIFLPSFSFNTDNQQNLSVLHSLETKARQKNLGQKNSRLTANAN